ncbi:hypothetical protein ACWGKK_12785 [Streptomyces chartreusis]
MPSMNFLLTGQDALSHIFDQVGHHATQLRNRIRDATRDANRSLSTFTTNASTQLSQLQRDTDAGGKAVEELGKVTRLLAPAAIPAAASLAPIAAGAGTVAVALGAMGAALGPQISKLGEASDAQKAYEDAVAKSGARSEDAVKAQTAYTQKMAALPPETRRAAAAVGIFKDEYAAFSDALAGDTMAPFTKGVAIANALLPKTRELVKGTSAEADRFVTIIGGEVSSPGIDSLNSKFSAFSRRTLRSVNDEIVHLLRLSGSGEVGGNARRFMDWARAQGPTVASVLTSVTTALVNVLEAGSDVGVGLLQAIDTVAGLVSAVPPGAIALFLQLALALKLTKAAALGLIAARTALAGFGVQLVAMNTAAAAAPGRLAAVRAAVLALSRTTRIAMAGTGIGLAILAITELAQRSGNAPPDVDKLTTSLRALGSTGKTTGEAAKHFGTDLDGLYGKVRSLTDPSQTDKIQQWIVSIGGLADWDSTPVKEAKENIDSVDKALANLVQGGQGDLAAAALQRLTAEYGKGGRDTRAFTKELNDYKSAVADAKFEQDLAAQSQGLFGAQAQQVQAKLDAQKRSADGLRQSIQALNDINRQALGGLIGFEASIDAAAKAARENAGVLDMTGGKLNLNGDKARTAAGALQDLASKTDEAAASARQSNESWETVNGIYARGTSELIKNARAMGLSKEEAAQLAEQLLRIPDKKTRVTMNKEDAERDLNAFNAAVKRSPGSKSVTLKTLSKGAEQILEGFGLKVKRLPNGKVSVSAATGTALGNIGNVRAALNSLDGKVARTTVVTNYKRADGASFLGPSGRYADGGTPKAGELAMVGEEGPELVVFGQAARVFDAKTTASLLRGSAGAGKAASQGLKAGLGSTRGVYAASRAMAAAVTAGIRDELEIRSPSKKTKALAQDVAKGFLEGLTGSRDKIKSVSKDLVKDIRTAFSGRKESGLVRMVDQQSKKLLSLAAKRDAVAKKTAEAKAFRDTTMGTARSTATLGNLGIEEGAVSAGSIKGAMGDKLAKIKQFTAFIKSLAAKGLHKTLLRQILEMGPEQGYAYANALAGADKATLTAINKTQYGLDVATRQLGEIGADRLYDSGKNASKGFLKGLESQEASIEKLMMKIAKGMQKSIKRALGIKSPSTVMAKLGAFSTEGLARGLVDAVPSVDRSMAVIAGRVSGIQPVLGRAAVAGRGAGGMTVNLTVQVSPTADRLAIGREIRTTLLELKRAHGGGDLGFGAA